LSEHGQLPDFNSLSKRLAAYGLVVFGQFSLGGEGAVVPGTGLSVEDYVAKVLLEYAIGKLKHQNSRGSLMTVLGRAMRNDIIDALRKKSHKMEEARATTSANEDSEEKHHEKPALDEYPQLLAPDPYSVVDDHEYRTRIRAVVDDEPPLKDLVEAVLDLELERPEDIADALGTTAADVQNRKKKLRRRLRQSGLVQLPEEEGRTP
jgi:RNA polymerase sigma factor (sigma-70 family)